MRKHYKKGPSCLSSVQSLSRVLLFATPWTTARQASLSLTKCRSLLKLVSIESPMPSNHLILCCPLLLLPSIFSSIGVFSNESVLLAWRELTPLRRLQRAALAIRVHSTQQVLRLTQTGSYTCLLAPFSRKGQNVQVWSLLALKAPGYLHDNRLVIISNPSPSLP